MVLLPALAGVKPNRTARTYHRCEAQDPANGAPQGATTTMSCMRIPLLAEPTINRPHEGAVHIKMNRPIALTDVNGVERIVRFLEMIGHTALLEYEGAGDCE